MHEHEQSLVERLIATLQALTESNLVQAEAIHGLVAVVADQVAGDDGDEGAAPRTYLDGRALDR